MEPRLKPETSTRSASPSGCQLTLQGRGWLGLSFGKSRQNALRGDVHFREDIGQRVVRCCRGRCRCFQATGEVARTCRRSWRRSWCRTDPWWQKDWLKQMQLKVTFKSMILSTQNFPVTDSQMVHIMACNRTPPTPQIWKLHEDLLPSS